MIPNSVSKNCTFVTLPASELSLVSNSAHCKQNLNPELSQSQMLRGHDAAVLEVTAVYQSGEPR